MQYHWRRIHHSALALLAVIGLSGCEQLIPNIVVVTPIESTIQVGRTVDLDAAGTRVDDEPYLWSSESPDIAEVNEKGVVTGIAPGTAFIVATGEQTGDTGSAMVRVEGVPETFETPTVTSFTPLPEDSGVPGVVATLDSGEEFLLDAPIYTEEYERRSPDRSGQAHANIKSLLEEGVRMKQRPNQPRISLSAVQTPIKNQQDRGTCVSHATLAAMEAFYNRIGIGPLDLSEQHFQHVGKTRWLHDFSGDPSDVQTRDGWENQLALGGGGNIYGALEFMLDYRVCEESFHPYEHTNKAGYSFGDYGSANQPGDDPRVDWRDRSGSVMQTLVSSFNMIQEPTTYQLPNDYTLTPLPQDALDNAIYGVTNYIRVPSDRIHDEVWYEQQIAAGREILIGLRFLSNTEDGILYPRDRNANEGSGGHAMLIVGYDRTDADDPFFIVKNSWGGSSYVRLSYDFLSDDQDGSITQAACITGVVTPDPDSTPPQIYMGRWRLLYDGVPGTLDIHRQSQFFPPNRLNGLEDYRLGAFYTSNGDLYRVNGTIDSDGRMEAYIDFQNPALDYETRSGLRFVAHLDRGNTKLIAGTYEPASGGGTERAFYASKDGFFNPVTAFQNLSPDSFLGEWEIQSPVVEGSLEFRDVDNGSFDGRYNHSGGWIVANGIANSTSQEVSFTIPLTDGGAFEGYIHQDNPGIISGNYTASGNTTGMVLVREGPATETITITEPETGDSFSRGATIALRSTVEIDGMEEPNALVIWTQDGPYDPADPTANRILSQSGPDGSTKLGEGAYDIYATYVGSGAPISDSVSIVVTGPSDPQVSITSPANDSFHQDLTNNPPSVDVDFEATAEAADGTPLTGTSLSWSYREEGDSAWTDAGVTGESVTINLRDRNCAGTAYDVRVVATDSSGNTASALISVFVSGFFCR